MTYGRLTASLKLNPQRNPAGLRPSSLEERSLVYFFDNPPSLLNAYVDSGEGLDRAGGFAIQVRTHVPTLQAA